MHWVFVAASRLSLAVESGHYSSLWCAGFSRQWLLLLQSTGSRRTGSILAPSMWKLPRAEVEPMSSPALAGGFLTTGPPGKSPVFFYCNVFVPFQNQKKKEEKVCIVKAMVFPVIMYGCDSWTVKKAEHQRIGALELCCWQTIESTLDSKKIKPVHPEGNQS